MKHYFLTYEYTKEGMKKWEKSNTVLDKHPVAWLKDMINNYNDSYRIAFYAEIEKEQFDLINGWID